VEFALEDPPEFGQYAKVFDEEEVMAEALKNSLSLKQAKREVETLTETIERYERQGQYSQAERQAANGASVDLALKETRQNLVRTVEDTMKNYGGLEAALEKKKEELYEAQRSHITVQMKQKVGAATINELRQAEKAVLTAERAVLQARYDCYMGAKKVILLKDGILVN
jgi:outer membrane protein TolC